MPHNTSTSVAFVPEALAVSKPQAILFDWDNTLTRGTMGFWIEALNLTRRELGMEIITQADWDAIPHVSMRDLVLEMFPENPQHAHNLLETHFSNCYRMGVIPIEGVRELLHFLQESNIYLGIVSNKHGLYLRREVEFLGWQTYFSTIVGSMDHPEDKPSPIPAMAALEPSGIAASPAVWFIGDSEVDLKCARNCGFQPVIVGEAKTGFSPNVCFEGVLRFEDCISLKNFVKELAEPEL